MNFVYVDVDNPDAGELIFELEVFSSYIPTFFFLNAEGDIVGQTLIGGQPDEVLEQAIIDVLVEEGVIEN